jgi:hypothetical protein
VVKVPLGRFATEKNVIAGIKIGDFGNRQRWNSGSIFAPMKTINRMALGTISSLLLSAGLARVAQRLDPLTNSIGNLNFGSDLNEAPANTCTSPCLLEN